MTDLLSALTVVRARRAEIAARIKILHLEDHDLEIAERTLETLKEKN